MLRAMIAGAAAGAVNGLFGAGGGMILVPILSGSPDYTDEEVFSSSIMIILPICIISLIIGTDGPLPWAQALPYVAGGIPGGILAATVGKRIPTIWLHRILGILILYGGMRYLW